MINNDVEIVSRQMQLLSSFINFGTYKVYLNNI